MTLMLIRFHANCYQMILLAFASIMHVAASLSLPRRLLMCSTGLQEQPLFGGIWLPSTLVVAYVYQLYRWSLEMRATRLAGIDPFKATAMYPAAVGTVLYLAALCLGKRAMATRQPYNCKNCMFVYNLYQVSRRF
jgi:hypothetical protein